MGIQKEALLKDINDKRLMADQILSWIDRRLQEFHMETPSKDIPFDRKFKDLCTSVL
jgi:hypothetical protein